MCGSLEGIGKVDLCIVWCPFNKGGCTVQVASLAVQPAVTIQLLRSAVGMTHSLRSDL